MQTHIFGLTMLLMLIGSLALVAREIRLYRRDRGAATPSQLAYRILVGLLLATFVVMVLWGAYEFSPQDRDHVWRNWRYWAFLMAFGSIISFGALGDFVIVMLRRRRSRRQQRLHHERLRAELDHQLAEFRRGKGDPSGEPDAEA